MAKTTKNHLIGHVPQRPGGYIVDYIKTYRRRPKTGELREIICKYVEDIRSEILAIRDVYNAPVYGRLAFSIHEMNDRWELWQVGHSRSAWMERSVIFTAMLLDYRSVQFGRQAQDTSDFSYRWGLQLDQREQKAHDEDYKLLDPVEFEQAAFSSIFIAHWQQYLKQLFIRPPGNPPPANEFDPTEYTQPNWNVAKTLAELSYCRPVGAFFKPVLTRGSWIRAGGRETCRKRTICPHCHARNTTRLVNRVEQGPWRKTRRRGRHLVFLRVSISTKDLELLKSVENPFFIQDCFAEAVQIRDRYQLRTTDFGPFRPDHTGLPGDATTIAKIDCKQSLSDSLTRLEVSAADEYLKSLVEWCRSRGVAGGIQFHSIGPKGQNFQHDLSVVGEIDAEHVESLTNILCNIYSPPMLDGLLIEGIVFAEGYADAARLAIAGSSWKFDLNEVGASLNPDAASKCFHGFSPKGLRGAMAWQPLFLMSSVAFWSRFYVLQEIRFKSNRAFGNWQSLLVPDRKHKSVVQERREREKAMEICNSPAIRLQELLRRMLEKERFTQSQLAAEANVSTAAVSRFLRERYGSAKLIEKLKAAMERLNAANLHCAPRSSARLRFFSFSRFMTRRSVERPKYTRNSDLDGNLIDF